MATEKMKKRSLSAVSLFTGAGGLDIAACRSGRMQKLFSTDSHPKFLETTEINLPKHFPSVVHKSICCDARDLNGHDVCDILTGGIDLLFGGPPCDDFTKNGKRRGLNGLKGPLIWEFARLVGELNPKAFVFENVPNLVSRFGDAFDDLLNRFRRLDYSITWVILTASSYGAPTNRKRVFIVGFKSALGLSGFEFPLPSHGSTEGQTSLFEDRTIRPFVTVADVLQDLPDVGSSEALTFLNHTPRFHRPRTIQHMRTVPQGREVAKSYRYRAPWNGLCWSLTAGLDDSTKAHLHPLYHREMSVREYARIHGFPDSWEFCGSRDNGLKQVANSVPIPLGSAVLAAVCKLL